MKVDLDKLEQSYSLNGGPVETHLVITLPSGAVVKAQVTEAAAQQVINELVGGTKSESALQVPEEEPTQVVEPAANEIDWKALPESVLPADYKQIFSDMGVPELLPLEDFEALVDEISSHLAAQAVPAQPPQPKPAVPHVIPRRRVASDDFGYPVVQGLRPAPGGSPVDADEDGVAQL